MRMKKSIISLILCLVLICCSLSLSSFASYLPFGAVLREEKSASQPAAVPDAPCTVPDTAVPAEEKTTEEPLGAEIAEETDIPETETVSETAPETETNETAFSEPPETDPISAETEESAAAESVTEPSAVIETKSYGESLPPLAAAPDTELAPGTDVKGSLASASDEKGYVVTLTKRGVLQYSFTHPQGGDKAWKISLYQQYNTNGYDGELKWRLLNVLETSSAKTVELSPHIGLQKGVYRITVSAGKNYTPGAYTLNAGFTPGTEYEIEYNDTVGRYTEICPGVPLKGSSLRLPEGSDNDWYMFRVHKRGAVNIALSHVRMDSLSVFWRVSLFDANGSELYAANSLSTDTSTQSGEIGLLPGCYFICVTGRVYTDFDYTLSVSRTVGDDYEKEDNGSAASADALAPGGSIRGALTSTSGENDKDVFSLTLASPGYVRFTFAIPEGTDDKYTHRIRVTDKNGAPLWDERLSPAAASVVSPPLGLGNGTYYITVDNDGLYASAATYTLSDEYFATSGWERESNGTLSSANDIRPDIAVSGTTVDCEAEYDDDYFRLTVSKAAIIGVSLRHDLLPDDKNIFTFRLLDGKGSAVQAQSAEGEKLTSADGTPVTLIRSSGNTEGVYAYYSLPAGTYYIRVTSGLFASDIRYSLTYTVRSGG